MTDMIASKDSRWPKLEGTSVIAPITKVVVLEDRAQITRRVELDLEAGPHRLAAWPVSPLVADRSLRCRIRAVKGQSGEPRLRDTSVRRRFLVRSSRPDREQEIREAIDRLVDEYRDAAALVESAWHERELGLSMAESLAAMMNERLSVGAFDEDWPNTVAELRPHRSRVDNELLALQDEQEDRRLRLRELASELELSTTPLGDYQAALTAELEVAGPGRYEIEWEYLVPCAIWRPEYIAELIGQEAKTSLRWTSAGTVWQSTGEDWKQVELSFSTERPSLGAELPLLEDDVLCARDKTEEEKKTIEVTSRDEVVSTTTSAPQRRESDTPPGLDDGGEARSFKVPHPVDVISDGRPHRLTFEEWSAPAATEQVCAAEKALFVFLRSLQTNPSAMPLLAGPVTLVRGGGYIGRSAIGYIAPKERFALSWGSEDGMVVLREAHRGHEEKGLRKHHRHELKVQLYLANHTEERRITRVIERVPVTELAEVEVTIDEKETSPGFSRSEQGHLTWQCDLAPGAEAKLRLSLAVTMPQNVHWRG